MKKLVLISLLVLSACAHKEAAKVVEAPVVPEVFATPKTIEEAVASPFRTTTFTTRDVYRHPVETLKFFGLKPNMKVIEIAPGAGWYMEILAPFLNDKGHYTMAARLTPATGEFQTNAPAEWAKKHPEIAKNISAVDFDLSLPEVKLGAPASVNMVLTFRNVHNWMSKQNENIAFKAFYKVLKRGGILGVVEHRANVDQKDPLAKSGYVRESDVIKMAKKAGFHLVAKSEINANPKDTKDYENGVWTLPPTLTLKDQDREKYLAIGESDRMTLKFVKP